MRKFLFGLLLISFVGITSSQTPGVLRVKNERKRDVLESSSLIKDLNLKNIGPTIMSGRVTDIAVNPDNPSEFYVAYASGGLWKTTNNGMSFTPLFDQEAAMTIGAIAVDWNKGIIYIGTGEVNSSRSSYAGVGVYRSDDAGGSWKYMGLPESHHIGSIVMHPQNADIAWVAVLGHLYTDNPERGVYKTENGGKDWKLVLSENERTGAVELTMDPTNSDRLYACMWERDRKAWNFNESGPGSGIWVSENGGDDWEKLTTPSSGFPAGVGMGRTGLAIYSGNSNIIYAVVDNQFPNEEKEVEVEEGLTVNDFQNIDKEKFLALEDSALNKFLIDNGIPEKYTAEVLKQNVKDGTFRPTVLNEYMDLGAYVFNAPIRGCEVYKSTDAGKSWTQVDEEDLFSVYNTYGYYFGKIAVSSTNPDKVVVLGVPVIMSEDGGVSWSSIGSDNVHADHHVIWINPNNDNHMILGNDGGINITYDSGKNWFLANTPAVGQFYSVAVDDDKPYNVYGGLQDNGVWYGSSNYTESNGWRQNGKYPYTFIYGGDGMQVEVDTRDNETIYTGYQFGYYSRLDEKGVSYTAIRPRHNMGEYPLRFNWQTPIKLSDHNQDVLYYGSNRFHRSLDKGNDLESLSDDLTNGGKPGNVPFGTITTISESPIRFGLLYIGTDDGFIHKSENGGYDWEKINQGLPEGLWVSRVVASKHQLNRVYLSLNGYRNDDFEAYLYKSENGGKNWYRMGQELPMEPVNVILEDPVNPNILYVGTDNGLYLSLNGGDNWMAFTGTESNPFPRVAVHDLVIQERENELVVATHGRSLYVADVSIIQKLNDEILGSDLHLFPVEDIKFYSGQGTTPWWRAFGDPDVRTWPVYIFSKTADKATIKVFEEEKVLYEDTIELKQGLNTFLYDSSISASDYEGEKADNGVPYLKAGNYSFKVEVNGKLQSADFEVIE